MKYLGLISAALIVILGSTGVAFGEVVRPIASNSDSAFPQAVGINNLGLIVGLQDSGAGTAGGLAVWDQQGNEHIQTVSPGVSFQPTGIDDSGNIFGIINSSTHNYASVFSNGQIMMLDGPSHNPSVDSAPTAVAAKGFIAGNRVSGATITGVLWHDGKATTLTKAGDDSSDAQSVNSSGEVVVNEKSNGSWSSPLLWSKGVFSPIQVGKGLKTQEAVINDLGDVAATAIDATTNESVLVKTEEGKRIEIPCPTGLTVDLSKMNDRGQVIGMAYDSNNRVDPDQPFLWDDSGFHLMNDIFSANSGWTFRFAADINNRGQIIGRGSLNNTPVRAFVLQTNVQTVPLPSPAWLGATTLPLAMWAVRARRKINTFHLAK